MDWSKHIRVTLGLSQRQMSEYLSLTRSQIAMAECGKRKLSLAAIEKLTYLHQLMVENKLTEAREINVPMLPEEAAPLLKTLEIRERECSLLAERSARTLEALTATYQRCQGAYPIIQSMLANLPEGKDGIKNEMWLRVWEVESNQKVAACSLTEQHNLKLGIQVLESEAAAVRQLIDAIRN